MYVKISYQSSILYIWGCSHNLWGILFVLIVLLWIILNYDWLVDCKYFYILTCFENRNCFRIVLNKIIYTINFYHYLRVWSATEKGYQSTVFKPRNATLLGQSELNHASKCQALSTTKSEAKRAFLEGGSQE